MDNKKLSLKELIQQRAVEAAIEAKLATGKFKDSGKKYNSAEAIADASNPALRLTASIDGNGKLNWSK